jgi:filamentous hemagglutinin family protein
MTATVRRRDRHSDRHTGLSASLSLRVSLLATTTIVGGALPALPAMAQSVPILANAGGATVSYDGPVLDPTAMNVNLNDASRILDFVTYDVAAGKSVNYSTTTAGMTDLVAVNRVLTGPLNTPSVIDGTINAAPGISVWLVNQEGIAFNGNAVLNGGSLMLSTLDFATDPNAPGSTMRTAFAAAGAANATAFRFLTAAGNTSAITIGGNLTVAGSIVAVGQTITTDSALTAGNGSVVLVAASDVTFSNGLGNPLAFTVNAGTALGGAIEVNDDLTGRSVVVAGGMQDNLTAALLNIAPDATLTATAAGGTVTLATASTGDVGIVNGAGALPSIAMDGRLIADGAAGSVTVQSAADLTGTGTILADGAVAIGAARDISVAGSSYTATNGALGVAASRDATLGALAAGTDMDVTARNVTLSGDVDAGGALGVVSTLNTTVDGTVTTDGDVSLTVLGATAISGDITAGGDYLLTRTTGLTQSGTVVADGNAQVSVTGTAQVTGGHEATTGALTINVGGAATLGALTAGTDIGLTTGAAATVEGAVDAGNDFTVRSGGNATLNGIVGADNDVVLSVGGGTFVNAALTAGRDFTVAGLVAGDGTTGYTQSATVTATRNVDLTVDGDALVTGALTATTGQVGATVGNNASFAAITAGTDIVISAIGAASFTGPIDAGNDFTVASGADTTLGSTVLTGNDVALAVGGATFVNAAVIAGRDVTVAGLVAGDGTTGYTQSGAVAATRDIALTVDGDALATGALTATTGQVEATVGNDARFAAVTAGTDIRIAAGNAANFTGAIDAGTDFAVTSGANTTLGSTVLAGNDVSLAVGGGTFVNGTVAAGRDFTVAGDAIGAGTASYIQPGAVTAGRTVSLTVDGTAQATGALTATSGQVGATIGGDAGFAAVSAGTDVLIDALGNATFGGALTADGDIGLTAGGTLAVRAEATAGDDYQLTASAITLGTAGQAHMQSAVGRVLITASTGDIVGVGGLTLRSNANGAVGGGNLELLANLGAVNFGTQTALVAGLAGGTSAQRSSVFVTSAPGVTLGNVTAFGLATSGSTALTAAGTVRTGNLLLDSALTVTATGGAIVLGDATVRGPGAVIQLAASGATGDVTTGALITDRGDILVSAARAIDLGSAATALTTPATPPVAGAIGLLAGGTITAGALFAGDDIAARATGAITVTSAQAGDDIDFASTAGAIALGTGTARGASLSGTSLAFGTPGLPGSVVVVAGEDVQLAGSAIRLTATTGDVTSATQLTTAAGNVIVNAGRDVSLAGVAATGGSIAVRAGRDVVQATTLTATTGDIAVGAGGDAMLGTLTAGDDIDLTVTGNLRWTALQSLAGPDAGRYVDVISGTPGALGGVTFGLGDDLALAGAAVVRITAGSVGDTTAGPLGLIAQDVTTSLFNAHAVAGDIRIGTMTSTDDVTVTADAGSVTGLPTGYAAATGGSIAGADSVLLTVAGSATIGAITAGAVTGGADTLRIGTVTADSVGLSAVQTLDLGTVVAGTVDLTTTGGAPAASTSLEILAPATALAPGFGAANLEATAAGSRVVVSAGGVAQLGTLLAGSLAGPGGGDQIVVDARALTVTQARAFDGALALTARDGLLRLDNGQAAERISLVKGNDDGASLGSDLITDILDAGTLQAGHGIAIRSATSARVASATAGSDGDLSRHIFISAAKAITVGTLDAQQGSIGLLAGTTATATTLTAAEDVAVQAGTGITVGRADAGDDIDMVALTGTLTLTNATPSGGGLAADSVSFAGGTIAVTPGEDAQLVGTTMRLRAATGDIVSTGTLTAVDDLLANAAGDISLATARASAGSIGLLAGGDVRATSLRAAIDIGIQAGTGIVVGTARADDDIDLLALTGDIALTSASTDAVPFGTPGTSVIMPGLAGSAGAVAIAGGEDAQFAPGATIRLRAAAGDVTSTGPLTTLDTAGTRNDILVNAAGDVSLTQVIATSSSIGILAGGAVTGTIFAAGVDIGIQGGTGVTITGATAGDDIDVTALTGTLSLASGLSTGADAADTSAVRFTGAAGSAGSAGALTIATGEDAELANASIRLRAATGDVISTGTLRTQSEGDVLVNTAGDAALNTVTAAGAIGVLAGRDASATTLTALSDIGLAAGRDARITTATAGDDIDAIAGRNLALVTGISLASPGTGGTSVTLGTAGALHAVTVTAGEDSQLARASIRLRTAGGSIAGTFTPLLGTTLTTTAGDILLNAGTDATVLGSTAGAGSIGVLAGGGVDATTLTAARDIGVQGGTGVTIATARAGDDIDVVSLAGTLALTNGTATGLGAGGTSVLFGGTAGTANALGIGAEDAQLTGATIRLRAANDDVVSAGTLAAQGVGEVLVNASGNANLATVTSGGSIGLLAGGGVIATTLTASRDIGVQGGTGVTIASATAGDDIDVVALTGTLALTNGTAAGLGAGGPSMTTVGAPGTAAAVGIAMSEDPQFTGASIRLRAAAGDITSTGTLLAQRPGEVLINASGNAALNTVTATAGSIGLLAGGRIDAATLTASRDIGVQAGTGVTIATATAGDDIDVVALTGTLALTNTTSTGLGGGGTTIRHTAAPGTAAAVGIGGEETQLTGATVRLRAATGAIVSTGTLRTRGTGEILVNAAGDAALATVTADAGSIGLLAGGRIDATTLSASRDIGVQASNGVTIATATAGDDIDVVALAGTLALTNATSIGTGTSGTSVLTTAAPGTAGAVGIGAEDAQLTGASIRLRAANGDVTSTGTLAAQGTGEVLANASGNATLATVTSGGSIGLLAGGAITATTLTASRDIGVQGGTGVTIAAATAGDDIDVLAVAGDLALTDATSTGGGAGTTSVDFGGTAGALDAVGITVEDPQLTAATIRLRAASGDILSTGTLLAQGTGELLVNASGDAALATTTATAGSIGVLAGGRVDAATLTASRDIGVQSGTGVTIASATAGDDIDVVALAGTVTLTDGTATHAGAGGTSVRFGGTAGLANAVGIGSEDSQLGGSTIRLLAASGDIASSGILAAEGNGDVLANASGNAALATVTSGNSIGVLAGGAVTAATLTAGHDIGVQGGTGVTIASATAGDDVDVVALAGTVALTDAASTGAGAGGASVQFGGAAGTAGAVGIGDEDTQLTGATIRLRAAVGNVVSTGTLAAQGAGEVLVNASGNANLAAVTSGGSIGVLAGGRVDATTLTASRDIGVQAGTGVTIAAATAGDDIDVLVATGDLALTNATSSGVGTGATSLIFSGTAGAANAVGIGSEDAQLGAATIRLRTADGDVTSTGTVLTQGAGEVLVNASGNATLAAVTTNAGSIGVLAGGRVDATTLTASRDIGVQGDTGVTIATATAGDDIDVAALAGTVTLTNGTATGAGADGTSVRFGGTAGLANAVGIGGEDAQLSGATIRVRAAGGNLVSAGTLAAQGTGEVLVNASGNANLATVTSGGSIGVLVGGALITATLTASRDIGVQAGTGVTIASATAGDDIDVVALGGDLSLGRGLSTALAGSDGSSVLFAGTPGAGGAVGIGGEDAQLGGAAIRLRAAAGNVVSATSLAAQGTGDVLVNAAGSVRLASASTSLGSLGVLAGTRVDAAGLAAGGDVVVRAGTGITVGTAQAGDDIDMVALAGNLALTDGLSTGTAGAGGSSVVFTGAAGSLAALGKASGEDAQLGGATIRLRAAGGNVASTGMLETRGAGDVLVNAKGDVALATTRAGAGSVALLAGGALTAATTTASEDVAVRAATNATLTTITAGDDIAIAAGGLVTTGTGSIGASASGLDARHTVFDAAQAGQAAGIAFVAGDPRGAASLPTGSALAAEANARSIVIEAANVDLQGALTNTAGRIVLRNTGANPTVVGDATVTTGATFALSNAELGRLRGASVVVDAGTRALELGTLTLDAATGTTDTRFLSTGAVEITGPVTVAGTAERTLQIGGLLGELGDDAGAEPLATSIIARIDRATAPKIDAGAAHVELRGEKILFGTSAMVDEYIGKTNAEIALIVANPASKLYSEAAAQPLDVFLTAKRVTVGYKNFALFQNTDINRSTGVLINAPVGGVPDQTALALRLISTGESGNNSFAMFGVVNGLQGSTAALLTNQSVEIVNPTGNLNDFRVTRASSRLNGCVIGAPDRGCLSTDVPQPNFNFYDERRIALFDVDDQSTIAISPLIGRGNDGLIVNVADAPVGIDTIECRPEDPTCPAKEGQ